jgi:hypothetical protein
MLDLPCWLRKLAPPAALPQAFRERDRHRHDRKRERRQEREERRIERIADRASELYAAAIMSCFLFSACVYASSAASTTDTAPTVVRLRFFIAPSPFSTAGA